MRKKAVNLTISEEIRARADRTMAARGFSSFSAYVEQLIRDEYDRRIATVNTFFSDAPQVAAPAPAQPVTYSILRPVKSRRRLKPKK